MKLYGKYEKRVYAKKGEDIFIIKRKKERKCISS